MVYYSILWYITVYYGILWYIMVYYGILWYIMGFRGRPQNSIVLSRGTPEKVPLILRNPHKLKGLGDAVSVFRGWDSPRISLKAHAEWKSETA